MTLWAPLRLRPLEVGDLLDETFRIYRRHFPLFAAIAVILAIPSAALMSLALAWFATGLEQTSDTGADITPVLGFLASFAAAGIVNIVLLPFTYGAITYAACESALGRPVTAGGVLRGVLRRYFPLLGYWLLFNTFTMYVALLLCVAPFIVWTWVYVMWVAATPAMFVEGIGLGQAISRSRYLVEGRWWRTFLILFLMAVVTYIVRLGLNGFLTISEMPLEMVLNPFLVSAIVTGAATLIAALVTPVVQILIVLIYFDLRVRREALDLFQMAFQLAAPPATI
jgi:hypothetical protein